MGLLAKRWMLWLLILLGTLAVGAGVGGLLLSQGIRVAGTGIIVAAILAAHGWSYFGLYRLREHRWARWTALICVVMDILALLTWRLLVIGSTNLAIGNNGVWLMGLAMIGGLALIRMMLVGGHPVIGVARTLIDEAIRLKVALVFLVCLALWVPALPATFNPAELLNYRLKSFLTWAISGAGILLSLMTVCVACWTITKEIERRQIYLCLTKPISRGQYLLGKWLGLAILNLWLVAVTGLAIWLFARMLATEPYNPNNITQIIDRGNVQDQVLVARVAEQPWLPEGIDLDKLIEERLKQLRQENELSNPDLYGTTQNPKAYTELNPRTQDVVRNGILAKWWYTIPPLNARAFRFTGLQVAKRPGDVVQLRINPKPSQGSPDSMVHLAFRLNGRDWPLQDGRPVSVKLAENSFHVVSIPAEYINDKGELEVAIANVNLDNPQATVNSSISFTLGEGIEILYRVGSFEGNLLRALTILWLQLAFLAGLGLACGTFLSFPVALLLTIVVLLGGICSDYLADSLRYFGGSPPATAGLWDQLVWWPSTILQQLFTGNVADALKNLIKLLGMLASVCLPSLGKFDASGLVADGRQVSGAMLGQAGLQLGVLALGGSLLAGWLIFRRRELASAAN